MAEEKKPVDYEKLLENLEKEFHKKETEWNLVIEKLTKKITGDLKNSIELSAEAISQRQILLDARTKYYYKIYKSMPTIKNIKKARFEYYSTKYQIKINGTEKNRLIEADLGYHEAKMEFIQNHINYLTECIKNIDHVIWSVKNKIELYNITGLD